MKTIILQGEQSHVGLVMSDDETTILAVTEAHSYADCVWQATVQQYALFACEFRTEYLYLDAVADLQEELLTYDYWARG